MPKISVIVPVYKVEKYIEECVNSVLNQTFRDFELILIDDGSPDTCGAICDKFVEKDSRVIVIHQENQGLSGARNSGMDIAKGKYITFVDSDDVITNDYLENLYHVIERTNADIAVCRTYEFKDGTNILLKSSSEQTSFNYQFFDNYNACIEIYNGSSLVPVFACGKLFRSELVLKYRFPIGRLHEDQAFTPLVCYAAKKIVSIDLEMYCYRNRDGSITKEKFSARRYDDVWAIDHCIEFFEAKKEKEIINAAKKKRQRLLAVYAIYARRDGVKVPEKYKKGILKSLLYLKRNVSDEKYEYYLGQVDMNLVRLHGYWKKVKKLLKRHS